MSCAGRICSGRRAFNASCKCCLACRHRSTITTALSSMPMAASCRSRRARQRSANCARPVSRRLTSDEWLACRYRRVERARTMTRARAAADWRQSPTAAGHMSAHARYCGGALPQQPFWGARALPVSLASAAQRGSGLPRKRAQNSPAGSPIPVLRFLSELAPNACRAGDGRPPSPDSPIFLAA